jgi:hypothetical protein
LKNLPLPLFTKEGYYFFPLVKGVYPPLAALKATRGEEGFYNECLFTYDFISKYGKGMI